MTTTIVAAVIALLVGFLVGVWLNDRGHRSDIDLQRERTDSRRAREEAMAAKDALIESLQTQRADALVRARAADDKAKQRADELASETARADHNCDGWEYAAGRVTALQTRVGQLEREIAVLGTAYSDKEREVILWRTSYEDALSHTSEQPAVEPAKPRSRAKRGAAATVDATVIEADVIDHSRPISEQMGGVPQLDVTLTMLRGKDTSSGHAEPVGPRALEAAQS